MRISGNVLDRLLIVYLPIAIISYPFFAFVIPKRNLDLTPIQTVYLFLGYMLFNCLLDIISIFVRRIKPLVIDDNKIILANDAIAITDVISLQFSYGGRGFATLKFEIKQNFTTREVLVMDKPIFFSIFRPKRSKTLEYLYAAFPELEEKEINPVSKSKANV